MATEVCTGGVKWQARQLARECGGSGRGRNKGAIAARRRTGSGRPANWCDEWRVTVEWEGARKAGTAARGHVGQDNYCSTAEAAISAAAAGSRWSGLTAMAAASGRTLDASGMATAVMAEMPAACQQRKQRHATAGTMRALARWASRQRAWKLTLAKAVHVRSQYASWSLGMLSAALYRREQRQQVRRRRQQGRRSTLVAWLPGRQRL